MHLQSLEYMVVVFEGNHFTGEILPELRSLRERGIIEVVDLLFIQKDLDGTVTVRELSDLSLEEAKPYGPLAGEVHELVSQDDIEYVAQNMPNNCSAALALFEHTWADHLKETIARAQGQIIDGGLIPAADVATLASQLTALQASVQN
jgi:hypothetical protein